MNGRQPKQRLLVRRAIGYVALGIDVLCVATVVLMLMAARQPGDGGYAVFVLTLMAPGLALVTIAATVVALACLLSNRQ